MSSHARSILGANTRRTRATTSFVFTTALPLHSRSLCPLTIPPPDASSLVAGKSIYRVSLDVNVPDSQRARFPSQPAIGVLHRNVPIPTTQDRVDIADAPPTPLRYLSSPPYPTSATPSAQHPNKRRWRRVRIQASLAYAQQRRYSGAPSSPPGDKPAKDDLHVRSDWKATPNQSASESWKVPSGFHPNKHFINRLPHINHIHRPSKEDLLAAATGFWSRLKVRFKWFSIRSGRPFNIDEISAFFSWVLLGHVLWIVLGTTTFFSLAILAVNTVLAQETLARWIGNYLTKSSGIKVVFESAIVPKWGDGVITFKNVFVSRRPGQGNGKVSKGSPTVAAAAAFAKDRALPGAPDLNQDEDANYSQFDLSLDTVNVTLSFAKWFNGKGLLRDVEIKGVRGVIDRTSVHYPEERIDPKSYRHEHNPGDFEIDSFKLEDLLVTMHQPHGFRPFSISVFSCDLPRLRRQWLFYDFLSANTMSGSFDESLFTLHPRQTHGLMASPLGAKPDHWKKHSRLRIDGLNIDHLNRGVEGPFSWILEGNVDIVADLMLPADTNESIAKVMSDFYDRMEATVTAKQHPPRDQAPALETTSSTSIVPGAGESSVSNPEDDERFLVMDLRVHMNDVRAAVPLFNKDLSYVNNALIRPIVAYINSRKTFIPINCRVVKRASEFDGSWTIFDSGLMDDLSAETYEAFAKDVTDDQARMRRFKKVGLWSLQIAFQALFMGMAGGLAA
ncbi:MAG: hypothetical protein Q9174_000185 [Haloplaca sp. 1 TL-2023]